MILTQANLTTNGKILVLWPGGEVETRLSAKQICTGSIPVQASRGIEFGIEDFFADLDTEQINDNYTR